MAGIPSLVLRLIEKALFLLCLTAAGLGASAVSAAVFEHADEQGNPVFTDKPRNREELDTLKRDRYNERATRSGRDKLNEEEFAAIRENYRQALDDLEKFKAFLRAECGAEPDASWTGEGGWVKQELMPRYREWDRCQKLHKQELNKRQAILKRAKQDLDRLYH